MIEPSELILNPDGSIYHLNLLPHQIAHKIIFVGDQDRVPLVSKHFSDIDFETQKREFRTCTGWFNGERITVISTGIGPDNIDIVLNELDALVNIDFKSRSSKKELTSLQIVRIGTSGSIQEKIPVDSFVMGTFGLGFDGLLHAYKAEHIFQKELTQAFIKHTNYDQKKAEPYITAGSKLLMTKLSSEIVFQGITATANGFYGPQGRMLRLATKDKSLNDKLADFSYHGLKICNLEMETSAIYGLSNLMGHEAISLNAIIANRANKTFSDQPRKTIEKLIKYTLDKLTI
ncbi:nucleoside phosphorylase [Namhaeicola litoreus]|uniref:Uridine phosphorylase n=1 Tax=Namhaeicola litoreus TaxID=1052145 RepID=A0ABW3Y223_9FLAO